jgi:hypothetical protein
MLGLVRDIDEQGRAASLFIMLIDICVKKEAS